MKENSRNNYLKVFCFIFVTILFGTFNAHNVTAQKTLCKDTVVETLRRMGAKQLDSDGVTFEIEGARLSLSYSAGMLGIVQFELDEIGSRKKYEDILALIERIKPLGAFQKDKPFGLVGPAGWVTRTTEFSNAYIRRREQTCFEPNAESGCGIKNIAVFYWLPLRGKVEQKRSEKVDIKGFLKITRYYVKVSDFEVAVSKLDYRRLRVGQLVSLERTLSNDIVRLLTTHASERRHKS